MDIGYHNNINMKFWFLVIRVFRLSKSIIKSPFNFNEKYKRVLG